MKPFPSILGILLLATFSLRSESQTQPSNSDDYEELPELKASEILRDTILTGPHHKVREEVSTSSGANHFMIESDVGVFEAEGNEMLVRRVDEINAIAELKEVSRTDQFKNALVAAAKSPLAAAKSIVTDPVKTITNVPKGLGNSCAAPANRLRGSGRQKSRAQPRTARHSK